MRKLRKVKIAGLAIIGTLGILTALETLRRRLT